MNDEGAGIATSKYVSYVGLRIFLTLFSLFFIAGGVSMTLTMGKGVLQKQDWLGAIFLFVPLLFAAVGACGLYASIFLVPWREKAYSSISEKASTSRRTGAILVTVFGYTFFSIFLTAGFGALLGGCVIPAAKIVEAMSWTEVPCVILDGSVTKHEGDDSVTYRVSIRYRYSGAGKQIVSDKLAPVDERMSSRKEANALLAQYPPGSERHCYVSPRDPTKAALIVGGFPGTPVFLGLFGLVFMSVGGGGIYFTRVKSKEWWELQEARKRRSSSQTVKQHPPS